MSYKWKRVFKINKTDDFKKIFDDNWIVYGTNTISEDMYKFLNWKKIIFEKWFFPTTLDRENIKNIFNIINIKKVINDNDVIKYLSQYWWIFIQNTIFNNELITLKEKTDLINCEFKSVTIKSQIDKNNLYLSNCFIKNLKLNEIANVNTIKLENINEIWVLEIEKLNNINLLDINVKKITKLTIKDSSFDWKNFWIRNSKIFSTEFYNTNLWEFKFNWVKFTKLWFKYTTFNDCIFNNTNLPEYLDEKLETLDINISNVEQKDNYRQLKHVMDSNANYTDANRFYALEMKHYTNHVNNWENLNFKNAIKNLFNSPIDKSWEKLILNISFIISNFWTNISLNLFFIWYYLLIAYSISFYANLVSLFFLFYINKYIEIFHIVWTIFLIFIFMCFVYIWKTNDNNKQYNHDSNNSSIIKSYWWYIWISIILIWIITISLTTEYLFPFKTNNEIHFYWINTFTYLLNPFSWLTDKSMLNLYWTEQLWLIIHKIIYWTLIYQLIIALKRTTKR